MTPTKLNAVRFPLFAFLLVLSSSIALLAETISFTNNDLLMSTDNTFHQITAPGISPSLIPGEETFTLSYQRSISDPVEAHWYRFDFSLPTGFHDLTLNIRLSVDNEAQIFVNQQIAAVEDDTVVENFQSPFPEFTLQADNSVVNHSGNWDALPINQQMFQTGNNSLIIFATDNGGQGHFDLQSATIQFEVDAIPEPLSAWTLLLALVGLISGKLLRNYRL